MRRKDRGQSREFSLAAIDRCTHGAMALSTGEDTPYCLPLSFVRMDNSLYFHAAMAGRKTDLLRRYPRVCITFVAEDSPDFEEPDHFTTYFQSVIVTGTAVEVTEAQEKIAALRALCEKVTPEHMTGDRFDRAIAHSLPFTAIWRIDMDQITGKAKLRKR